MTYDDAENYIVGHHHDDSCNLEQDETLIKVGCCDDCGEQCRTDAAICPPFDVPFRVQEFMFASLAGVAEMDLDEVLITHRARILEMARARFVKGYAKYGSAMYGWTPEQRLEEVLEELSDAVVYLCSGPIA